MSFYVKRIVKVLFFGLMMLLFTHSSTDEEDLVTKTDREVTRVVVK